MALNSLLEKVVSVISQLPAVKQDAIAQSIWDVLADLEPRPMGGFERWARRVVENRDDLYEAMRETDHWRASGEPTTSHLRDVEYLSMLSNEQYEELQSFLIERHRRWLGLSQPVEMSIPIPLVLPNTSHHVRQGVSCFATAYKCRFRS